MQTVYNNKNIYKLLQIKYGIIGESIPMQEAMLTLHQAAPTDLALLITGETGTGKEVFANAVHGLSKRSKYPFVSVNCGAIPETLLESELFGHEKGAFTGAQDQRKGFFEVADKGTIFLDEIGEMPIGTQVKLLRILESGEFSRLGSSEMHRVDVRLIAATNRELEIEVSKDNFRMDLFYRLRSVQIKLPPLREHPEDIPLLIEYFSEKIFKKSNILFDGITDDAMMLLKRLPWHGNVRELKNLIETIIIIEKGKKITSDIITRYLPPSLPPANNNPIAPEISLVPSFGEKSDDKFELGLIFRTLIELKHEINDMKGMLRDVSSSVNDLQLSSSQEVAYKFESDNDEFEIKPISEMEKELITAALNRFDGNRRNAAQELGISERTLYRKIKDYDLDK